MYSMRGIAQQCAIPKLNNSNLMESNTMNNQTVVSATEAMESLSREELMKLVMDQKARQEFKKTLGKAPGHKETIMAALEEGPKSVSDLAKICDTTTKTVQSYICYLRQDGNDILSIGGKYRLMTEELKAMLK
jgi:biotin operon repressor